MSIVTINNALMQNVLMGVGFVTNEMNGHSLVLDLPCRGVRLDPAGLNALGLDIWELNRQALAARGFPMEDTPPKCFSDVSICLYVQRDNLCSDFTPLGARYQWYKALRYARSYCTSGITISDPLLVGLERLQDIMARHFVETCPEYIMTKVPHE